MNKLFSLALFSVLNVSGLTCARPDSGDDAAKVEPLPAAPSAAPKVLDDVAATPVKVPIDGLPTLFGEGRAYVTIVAFTDYECQYCRKADATLAQLRADYGDNLRVVIGSNPLPMHTHADPAARAFLAAYELGKGEAMHARLFAHQDEFDDAGLRNAAVAVGLDAAAFDRALHSTATETALVRAETLGHSLGVTGTPSFFVNGRKLVGARPIETFRSLVDEELAKAKALVSSGMPRTRVYDAIVASAKDVPKEEPKPAEVVDIDVAGAPSRGAGTVTIALFSDYQCPYCAKVEKTLRDLEAARPGAVRVVFKNHPLPFHDHARLAAKASLAAERQGKFWEYHDVLFEHPDRLERADLVGYATDLRLDPRRFERDMDDPAVELRIATEEKQAEKAEAKGTPTAFVNGRRITGAQPLSAWLALVDAARKQ